MTTHDTTGAGAGLGFLTGIRVLEMGDGVAGAAATSLLQDLGADVTTVADAASPHRHARPHGPGQAAGASLLSLVLDHGKHVVPVSARLDDLSGLIAHGTEDGPFDLVIFDRVGELRGPLGELAPIPAYQAFAESAGPGAWVTISAFGLSGPRAADPATELTIAAASGMLLSVSDPRTGRPLKLAGSQSLLSAAQAAALAGCHALDLARDAPRVHLDLSAVEATIATGPTIDVIATLLNTGPRKGAKRYGAPASFYPCRDGAMRISAMEDHQWQGVVTAMGSPSWARRFTTSQARVEGAAEVDQHIAEWSRTLPKAAAEELLQSHGVPATAMYTPAEILSSPQLAYRKAIREITIDGQGCRVIGSPFRPVRTAATSRAAATSREAGPAAAARPAAETGRRLRGLRVLEIGHVLAAPLAGGVLGALGADVTKLEDLRRLDMYRRRGPYVDLKREANWSAYFAMVNHSKRSVAFDVDASPDQFQALLDESDAIIENLGGRRASRLGVAAPQLAETRPDVLGVSSSGFGQDGPLSTYRAYAYNLHAACGLSYLTRNEDGQAAEIDLPWADLISAYALATVVAAWAVSPRWRGGAGIDFAMADLIVGHFNEFVAAASLDPDSDQSVDRANELSPYAPDGVYACSDGWVAISVESDQQYLRLQNILRNPELSEPRYADGESRFESRHELDAALDEACRRWPAAELAGLLRVAGIVAEEPVRPEQLPDAEQLASRDFFTAVEHPEWGCRRLIGIPWRPLGEGPIPLTAPPLLDPSGQPAGTPA